MVETLESVTDCKDLTPRGQRTRRVFTLWLLVWSLGFVAATYVIDRQIIQGNVALLAVIGLTALGLSTVRAYRKYHGELDELLRKIEMEALAVALGVGVVGGLSFWLLEVAELIRDAGITWLVTAMMVSYGLAVFFGRRRYR